MVWLMAIRAKNQHAEVSSEFDVHEPVEVAYIVFKDGRQLSVLIEFMNSQGDPILSSFDNYICSH